MDWKKRGAKVLGVFILGYSSGMAVTVPIFAIYSQAEGLDLTGMFSWPIIAGLVTALPQLGKVISEYGVSR